jgi:K+-sensing histidine kinase KdpD
MTEGFVLPLSTTNQPRWDRWASRSAGMDGTGRLSVRTARDGDRVLVEISDNGPGIPEAAAAHILEPFYNHQAGRPGHRPRAR